MGRHSKDTQYIQVTVIPVTGDTYDEVVPRLDFLRHAGALVGGYAARFISEKDATKVVVVDEDGLMRQLPHNPRASEHYRHPIVGTALLMPKKVWAYAIRDK